MVGFLRVTVRDGDVAIMSQKDLAEGESPVAAVCAALQEWRACANTVPTGEA